MAHNQNENLLASTTGMNINSAGTDVPVAMRASEYILRRVAFTHPSTSLGISLATIGVYTGPGGTGTVVVAPALLTGLTSASKLADMLLALTASTLSAPTLYLRNIIPHGSSATVDVYIFGDVCS